ncbi:MAG: efflux RND transporter permease subunit [Roseburia sp.]|nr:efflux RND transporter permease subunit [Roseburia sp.]
MSKFSVKKPYTVLVGVVLVIVLGVVSFMRMTADLLPSISLPYVIVMTTYAGASPETVETVVTQPVEAAMATISNIEGISSVSSENYSMVILEFSQSTDMNAVSLEIRESLDQIKSYWDDSVGNPIIVKMNPDMLPVMIAAVGVDGMDQAQISSYVQESIMPELESIEGVASASATGLLEESVNVIIRQDKVDALNQKVFGAIDDKMKEAEEELASGRKELLDGRKELEDGRKELLDGQKELADSKKELEDGKKDLEEGKKELDNQRNEISAKLATQKYQVQAAKANLESIQSNLTQGEKLNDGIKQIDEALEELAPLETCFTDYTTAMAELAASVSSGDSSGSKDAGKKIDEIKKAVCSNTMLAAAVEANEQLKELLPLKTLKKLDWKSQENIIAVSTALKIIQDQIAPAITGEVKQQREDLKAALNAITSGLGYDAYASAVKKELKKQGVTDIAKAIKDLDNALIEIEKGQMTAAIEMANGKATITIGEYQLEMAETQMEAYEEQIKSGLEQLEDARKQLKEGEEQLEDGEQQLADARQEAYDQANLHEILTVDTIEGLLTAQNFSMPAGYVTEEGTDYLIRVGDKPSTVEELKAFPLMDLHMDGVPVITLGDVADVFYTDNSDAIYTNVNGSAGVMLSLQKQTGYSTGDVSDKLGKRFSQLMEEEPGLTIITLMDQGIYIDLVMDSIISNILFGALLAIIILILFLKDIRPTLVVAFSIPISLVTAIVCMYFSGVTLNIISLSGLALGIGMLVDNSIVVIENIYRLRAEGYSMGEAAIAGAKEVASAIVASTLTTVCVFLPIVFTEGITRQLFVDMGLTIAYSLFASLVIALTVVPAMASKVLTKTEEKKQGRIFEGLINLYGKVLSLALKAKALVFVLVFALLGISVAAAMTNGTAFMSDMDSTQLSVSVQLDKEATLAQTAQITDQVVESIMEIEDVVDVGAMTASSTMSLLGGGSGSSNATEIYVVTREDKSLSNEEIAEIIYQKTAELPAEIDVQTSSMDMSALGGSGITIQVRGRDLDTLRSVAGQVAAIVESVEGTANVSDGLAESEEELRILIDRNKAVEYGLTVAQVFTQVAERVAEAGKATTLAADNKDYGIYVTRDSDTALTRKLMEEVEVTGTDEEGKKVKVPLSEIAAFEAAETLTSINRADQTRYVSVTAEIADGYNVGKVASRVESRMADFELPEGYRLVYSGENETINDALSQVLLMLLLALIFMYLIMVAQFQSLLSPFIIMFTIPLAFTGGFLGLFFAGCEVSVIAMIGFVMLAGVIVNNGIVLIDYMNQLKESGMRHRDAILTAGRTRLRPVLMTALTTILALSTMVFSNDMGSEMAKPMAVVTIGGLLYGTLLTLIVIPCVYDVFAGFGQRKRREP